MSWKAGSWWAGRLLLVACTVGMAAGASAPAGAGGWRLLFVGCALAASVVVWRLWRRGEVGPAEVVLGAVLLRLIAFPLLPGLSDDGYRYLWDGMLQAEGFNPYAFRPVDVQAHGPPGLFERLNSPGYFSVYPPAAQLVFYLGGLFGWPAGWFVVKAVMAGVEMAGVWALSRMVAPHVAVLYAWHPLAVVEVAGQGHLEGAMVGCLLLGVYACRSGSAGGAVAAVTVAGWFKLYPLVLLPFLLRRVGWGKGWVALGVSVVLWAPYAQAGTLSNIAESLRLYVRAFEFYAGPYYALKGIGWAITGGDVSKVLGPALAVGGGLGIAALFWKDRRCAFELPAAWLGALAILWATATTVHPWYLLGALALLPLAVPLAVPSLGRGAAHVAGWYVLAGGAAASYLFYSFAEPVYWGAVIAGWLGWSVGITGALFSPLLQKKLSQRGRNKATWVRPHLPDTGRVLDLGAGEGYVGAALNEAAGLEVVLADVADFNETPLPHVPYDGQQLPFEPGAFDAVLLVFVLHHAANPNQVLREARRVARQRVVVVESVYRSGWEHVWLRTADRLANRLRSGGVLRGQEEQLRFLPAAAWRSAFEASGLSVAHEEERGGWWHRQRLFVLEPA